MKITDNCVVHYHYTLKDVSGKILQSSLNNQALVYLHGKGHIVPGLEKEMAGKTKGDHFEITLSPEEGFGQRQDNLTERIPIKYLKGGKNWRPGMAGFVNTHQGYQQVQIIKVGRFMTDVDLNHPLAGMTLNYSVDIIEVRDATSEEIARSLVRESQ